MENLSSVLKDIKVWNCSTRGLGMRKHDIIIKIKSVTEYLLTLSIRRKDIKKKVIHFHETLKQTVALVVTGCSSTQELWMARKNLDMNMDEKTKHSYRNNYQLCNLNWLPKALSSFQWKWTCNIRPEGPECPAGNNHANWQDFRQRLEWVCCERILFYGYVSTGFEQKMDFFIPLEILWFQYLFHPDLWWKNKILVFSEVKGSKKTPRIRHGEVLHFSIFIQITFTMTLKNQNSLCQH